MGAISSVFVVLDNDTVEFRTRPVTVGIHYSDNDEVFPAKSNSNDSV